MADVVVEYIQKVLGGKITSYDDKPTRMQIFYSHPITKAQKRQKMYG